MAVQILGMSVFDFIPVVTSLLAVTISAITFFYQSRSQRRAITLHMHTIWNSEAMRKARRNGFAVAEVVKSGSVSLKQLPGEQASALLDIKQFFADLNQLYEVRALDNGLARKLFGGAIKVWFEEVFHNVEHDESGPGHQSRGFFVSKVLPLRSRLST